MYSHRRPCWDMRHVLTLEAMWMSMVHDVTRNHWKPMVYASAECKGQESYFCMVLTITAVQLRRREVEGFCDDVCLHLTSHSQRWNNLERKTLKRTLKIVIGILRWGSSWVIVTDRGVDGERLSFLCGVGQWKFVGIPNWTYLLLCCLLLEGDHEGADLRVLGGECDWGSWRGVPW